MKSGKNQEWSCPSISYTFSYMHIFFWIYNLRMSDGPRVVMSLHSIHIVRPHPRHLCPSPDVCARECVRCVCVSVCGARVWCESVLDVCA